MAEQGRVVIVDDSGKRHFFPAGFDPRRAASIVKQQTAPAEPKQPGLATIGEQLEAKGNPLYRYGANLVETLNPITMAKGIFNTLPIPQALGGAGLDAPYQAGKAILSSQGEQFGKAVDDYEQGRYSEMMGHGAAGVLPLLGPMAAEAGEQIGAGDVAGGLGKATGLVLPFGVKAAVGARAASRAANAGTRADYLERAATEQVAKRVLSPANPRYRGPAAEVAPKLLERGVRGDRIQVQQWADDLIGESSQKIDQAWDALPANHRTPSGPIVAELNSKLKSMEFHGKTKKVEVNPVMADTHAELTKLMKFVQRRGASLSKDDVRTLRQQFDDVAAKAGAFAKTSGDASLSAAAEAALDTANAFRRQIARTVPGLEPANADMHLGLTVRDILDPTKGRPSTPSVTTGATGGLHTTAALIGQGVTKIPGLQALAAFVASDLIPRIKNAQVSPANQLRLAQDKFKLAQALRKGDTSTAKTIAVNMAAYLPKGEAATRLSATQAPQR